MKGQKSVQQDSNDDEIDLEERHERAGSITSNSIPTVSVMPKDMYCFCKVIFNNNIITINHNVTLTVAGKVF